MVHHVLALRTTPSLRSSRWATRRFLLVDDDDDRPKLTMAEDNDKPRALIRSLDELTKETASSSSSSSSSSSASSRKAASFSTLKSSGLTNRENDRKDEKMATSATFGSMSIDDLKSRYVKRDGPMKSWSDLPKRTEDLNGINPVTTILFSAFPAVVCYLLTMLTTYLTAHFAVQFLSSDLYPVQRLAVVVRNLVVGLTTLASGFCGIISVGLFALGATVALGVIKGELDPNAENPTGKVE